MVTKKSEPVLNLPEGEVPTPPQVPDLTPPASPELTLPPLEEPVVSAPDPLASLPPSSLSLESPPVNQSKKYLWIILIIVAVALIGAVGYWSMSRKKSSSSPVSTTVPIASAAPKATAVPTTSPSPSSTTSLKRSEITLEILNGTTISGLAGKTKTEFETLGYTVESVGNAVAPVTESELYIKRDLEPSLSLLLQDVKDKFGITKVTDYLDSSESVSARLIVGKKSE